MEQAILVRILEIPDPAGVPDGEYADGLRHAVSTAVGNGLGVVVGRIDRNSPVPIDLLDQARQAARREIALDVVLRRYIAGFAVFNDIVVQTADQVAVPPAGQTLGPLLRAQGERLERLIEAASGEYMRECGERGSAHVGRRVEVVRALLAGRSDNACELSYGLDDWHIGAVARGEGAATVLSRLAEVADRRLLLVRPRDGLVWAWFGGRRRLEMVEVARRLLSGAPAHAFIALGEPARRLEGWRLTHRQAVAALETAHAGMTGVVRYSDVGLLASVSRDWLLARSLRQLYLDPLADGRDDNGLGLRQTLSAYFAAGRNVSSAASALGVSRQTVRNRLRAIEERLGRTVESCAPELEVALRLADRDDLAGEDRPGGPARQRVDEIEPMG